MCPEPTCGRGQEPFEAETRSQEHNCYSAYGIFYQEGRVLSDQGDACCAGCPVNKGKPEEHECCRDRAYYKVLHGSFKGPCILFLKACKGEGRKTRQLKGTEEQDQVVCRGYNHHPEGRKEHQGVELFCVVAVFCILYRGNRDYQGNCQEDKFEELGKGVDTQCF